MSFSHREKNRIIPGLSSSMFSRLQSLWLSGALLLHLIWGGAFCSEIYEDVTPTPDYDYNSTFDYYLYNGTETLPNYNVYSVLPDTGTVLVFRHYVMFAGLVMMKICQQT
ncbi:hypothetical protein DNTS_012153 [Danionella cerebrum]|uniref:Uncharacterized protein n=1 Tax=Danionella cerebrum TaxID=2873325 RepID=A0A553Q8Y2_9TELE|nr:hypothetical protein DNTS_012153 [Danionella translucida]